MGFVTRDGQRVAEAVARDHDRFDAGFRAATGCDLIVNSGTRTTEEQEAIFRDRYRIASEVKGRRVYDIRVWNGVRWYRISPAGTVAVPRTSNHEENGPIGPRALDYRDSGTDAGVTRAGTPRANWLREHAHEYNFNPIGYTFGEPWHNEWTGADPHAPLPNIVPAAASPAPRWTIPPGAKSLNPLGIVYAAGLQLLGMFHGGSKAYRGPIDAIMPEGSGSWAAFVQFLRDYWQYVGNDVLGPDMWRAIQRWLKARYGYTGPVNGIPGVNTRAALDRAENRNWTELHAKAGM